MVQHALTRHEGSRFHLVSRALAPLGAASVAPNRSCDLPARALCRRVVAACACVVSGLPPRQCPRQGTYLKRGGVCGRERCAPRRAPGHTGRQMARRSWVTGGACRLPRRRGRPGSSRDPTAGHTIPRARCAWVTGILAPGSQRQSEVFPSSARRGWCVCAVCVCGAGLLAALRDRRKKLPCLSRPSRVLFCSLRIITHICHGLHCGHATSSLLVLEDVELQGQCQPIGMRSLAFSNGRLNRRGECRSLSAALPSVGCLWNGSSSSGVFSSTSGLTSGVSVRILAHIRHGTGDVGGSQPKL